MLLNLLVSVRLQTVMPLPLSMSLLQRLGQVQLLLQLQQQRQAAQPASKAHQSLKQQLTRCSRDWWSTTPESSSLLGPGYVMNNSLSMA
jgi:hypothetical protein